MDNADIGSFAAQIENRIKKSSWVILKISPQLVG